MDSNICWCEVVLWLATNILALELRFFLIVEIFDNHDVVSGLCLRYHRCSEYNLHLQV